MSGEVAVDEDGSVSRMIGLLCRRVDVREGGQQQAQHERDGANNRGGRTHDVSIARVSQIVNQLRVWAGFIRGRVGSTKTHFFILPRFIGLGDSR